MRNMSLIFILAIMADLSAWRSLSEPSDPAAIGSRDLIGSPTYKLPINGGQSPHLARAVQGPGRTNSVILAQSVRATA